MEEIGQVVGISGDYISVKIKEQLGSCSSCSSCVSSFALPSEEKSARVVKLVNAIGAGLGDFVVLELKEGVSIFISILLYIFPVLMMLGGYFLGDYLGYDFRAGKFEDNIFAIGLSFVFLFFGFVIVYFFDRFLSRRSSFSLHLKSFYEFKE